MAFELRWATRALAEYQAISSAAKKSKDTRNRTGRTKASRQEGLFKQIAKTLTLLQDNPRHPGLSTHEYHSLAHPTDPNGKVFEAYAQNNTPSAYRVFWYYGPMKGQITIIAITSHP